MSDIYFEPRGIEHCIKAPKVVFSEALVSCTRIDFNNISCSTQHSVRFEDLHADLTDTLSSIIDLDLFS